MPRARWLERGASTLAIAILTSVGLTTPALAQGPAPYLYVVHITARLDRMQEFAAYEGRIQEARRRTGDPRSVAVYQVQAGGPANHFHAVIPFDDLSDVDSWPSVPELLAEAYGESEGARIYAEGTASMESVEIEVHLLQEASSSGMSRQWPGSDVVHLVTTRVDPGLAPDYEAFLAALKAAEDERGIRRIRRVVTVGPLSTYTAVNQAIGWSDMRAATGPNQLIVEAYGQEIGSRLLAGANAAIVDRTIEVLRVREDLSYQPD